MIDRLDLAIRGGTVLDPGAGLSQRLDVGIADGRIAALHPDLPSDGVGDVLDPSEAIRQAVPDLVILDLSEGAHRRSWRVLRQLKQQRETRAIPVLVSSAAAPALQRDTATLAEYGVHLLGQPVVVNELLGWTRQVMHRGT